VGCIMQMWDANGFSPSRRRIEQVEMEDKGGDNLT